MCGHGTIAVGMATAVVIDAQKIDAFAWLTNEKLDAGDTNTRKTYIR
ncbi:hypothetical protein IVB33_06625 [Bradyrhizobium sp. 24]|nr:hypothetical protein [Bradyrhizobium sp. 24]